jgi:Zn-finger protein
MVIKPINIDNDFFPGMHCHFLKKVPEYCIMYLLVLLNTHKIQGWSESKDPIGLKKLVKCTLLHFS